MAKQRLQHTRCVQATRNLLLAAVVLGLGVSLSWAGGQTPNTSPPSKTTQTAGHKTAKTTPAKSAKTSSQHKKEAATKSSTPSVAAGKRDPFKIPVITAAARGAAGNILEGGAPGGVLPPGVRGLLISQLILEGTVREQVANKMIAVVTNETKRAYFLTENESVYNGVVSKITPDAVYFKENVLDPNGRVTTREVVKRLGSAPGEGR